MFLEAWLLGRYVTDHVTNAQAEEGMRRAGQAVREVDLLNDRVDRLVLLCTALWSLLREKTGLTEKDLEARVREIDLQDGRLDGRMSRPAARSCPACTKPVSTRHVRCIWCGAVMPATEPFGGAT